MPDQRSRSVVRSVFAAVAAVILALSVVVSAQGQGQGNSLAERVAALESQMAALQAQFGALVQQVDGIVQQVNGLVQQIGALGALQTQVANLQLQVGSLQQVTAATFNVDVHCENGQTIGAALNQTLAHTGLVTITVSGTCTENIIVSREQTVIRAIGPPATITAANPGMAVVQFTGNSLRSRVLQLSNLTVSGGSVGVRADLGTRVHLTDVVVQNNSSIGISAETKSLIRLQNSTVAYNGLGVDARNGAQVSMFGGALQNNNNYGLQLQGGAVADLNGVLITANTNGGGGPNQIRGAVGLYQGATLRLVSTNITQNSGNGIFAVAGSTVWLDGGTNIENNGGNGIYLMDASVVGKFFATTAIQINNNGGYGIKCSPAPAAPQLYGFPNAGQPITTNGNIAGGISCPLTPPS